MLPALRAAPKRRALRGPPRPRCRAPAMPRSNTTRRCSQRQGASQSFSACPTFPPTTPQQCAPHPRHGPPRHARAACLQRQPSAAAQV